jgi:cell division protein FtsI (penicillin-binding protein 3)
MAEETGASKFTFFWKLPIQRVARREPAPAPLDWRLTIQSRLIACAIGLVVWTVGIEARLLYLQVVQYDDMKARADDQHHRWVETPAKRGDILDRSGQLLAYSVDAHTVVAYPTLIKEPDQTARLVCRALEQCDAARERAIAQRLASKGKFEFIERRVTDTVARRVRALDLDGIGLTKETRRYYPNRQLGAAVLGYVGIDNQGLGGLEATFDSRIRGRDGLMLMQADGRRRHVAGRVERPPTAGDSLELTINRELQYIAERELQAGVLEHNAAGGSVVIMDPQNGELLAVASYPTFNPNAFMYSKPEERRNRALQDSYEPGSTFKLVTASAALEEGVWRPNDLIDCAPGYISFPGRPRIHDVHTYGVLTFEDVIVKSSNVGAIKAGLRVGPERLGRWMNRFGFGQQIAPDFRGEHPGIVWNPAKLDESGLASVSMGYQVAVTPVQMAAAVSSVANGGTLYEPRVVRAFIRNGRREPVASKALRRTVTPETAATMVQIMEAVVERGTATAAQIDGYTVAGKTGTAAKLVDGRYSKVDYNTSFVGFAPSRDPALTVIVVIDSPHGKVTAYGGTVAAPIFKRITEAALRHLGVPATINAPPPVLVARNAEGMRPTPANAPVDRLSLEQIMLPARDGLMPDLRGMSARKALISINRIGLTPRIEGSGLVIEQTPEPGASLIPGDVAVLKLGRRTAVLPAGGTQQ